MGKKKGRNKYIPPSVLDEIDNIKLDFDLVSGSEAMRKMAKFSRVGREAKKKGLI